MNLIESNTGQTAHELADAMQRTPLNDGSIMLARFHTAGHLTKVSTSDIEMTPNTTIAIGLDEINKQIADQKGIQVKDLAVNESSVDEVGTIQETVPSATVDDVVTTKDEPLSDEDLARKMRTDADVMFKEAEQLRKDAEKLSPSTKAKASGKA